MEDLCLVRGRYQVQPDTTSFNIVIASLARSRERGKERRAEALLQRMDDLDDEIMMTRKDKNDGNDVGPQGVIVSCKPDLVVSVRFGI